MYGLVSFGKAFCLPPLSVVRVIEVLLIYVTILYSKYKVLSNFLLEKHDILKNIFIFVLKNLIIGGFLGYLPCLNMDRSLTDLLH